MAWLEVWECRPMSNGRGKKHSIQTCRGTGMKLALLLLLSLLCVCVCVWLCVCVCVHARACARVRAFLCTAVSRAPEFVSSMDTPAQAKIGYKLSTICRKVFSDSKHVLLRNSESDIYMWFEKISFDLVLATSWRSNLPQSTFSIAQKERERERVLYHTRIKIWAQVGFLIICPWRKTQYIKQEHMERETG